MSRRQVEALLASEDYGKDLASVNNLLKKHQLLEADISAHEVSSGAPGQCLDTVVHLGQGRGVCHSKSRVSNIVAMGPLYTLNLIERP